MRSPTSSHRRLHPRPSPPRRVDAVAHVVDEGTVDDPGHVLIHVIDEGDDLVLGTRPLEADAHPFPALAGFTAPADWSMVGLRVRGTARHLDQPDRPPERTSTTFVVDRDGQDASVLRTAAEARPLPGPAEGTIPDLCRRILSLPTAPAPPSTRALWMLAWLDRVVEALGDPARRSRLSSWAQVAVLHPAVRAAPDDDLLTLHEPARLIALVGTHVRTWSWARLRAEPDALVLPGGQLPVDVTSWMDDGFYARWAFGAFPDAATLVHDLTGALDPALRASLMEVLEGTVLDGP